MDRRNVALRFERVGVAREVASPCLGDRDQQTARVGQWASGPRPRRFAEGSIRGVRSRQPGRGDRGGAPRLFWRAVLGVHDGLELRSSRVGPEAHPPRRKNAGARPRRPGERGLRRLRLRWLRRQRQSLARGVLRRGTTCDDGNACTGPDQCVGAGGCLAGRPIACGAVSECQVVACVPSRGCVAGPKDDGTACASGSCEQGTCRREGVPDDAVVVGIGGAQGIDAGTDSDPTVALALRATGSSCSIGAGVSVHASDASGAGSASPRSRSRSRSARADGARYGKGRSRGAKMRVASGAMFAASSEVRFHVPVAPSRPEVPPCVVRTCSLRWSSSVSSRRVARTEEKARSSWGRTEERRRRRRRIRTCLPSSRVTRRRIRPISAPPRSSVASRQRAARRVRNVSKERVPPPAPPAFVAERAAARSARSASRRRASRRR